MQYEIERTDDNVLSVRHIIHAGWTQEHLGLADIHFDSVHCKRNILTKLLQQAKERDAGIFIIGDLCDVMQVKGDPRSSKNELRPEYLVEDYLDAVVDDAIEYFAPYRHNMIMVSEGNHETGVSGHHETNVIGRICKALDITHLGYAGYVRWMFRYEKDGRKSGMSSIPMWFHHGSSGSGDATKGVMRAQREMGPVPDARIYVGGHIHRSWRVDDMRVRLTPAGKTTTERTLHVCLPTMKDEFNLRGGYHIVKGRWPRVIGGLWFKFWYDRAVPGFVQFDASLAL
jgi:hypothetical protein